MSTNKSFSTETSDRYSCALFEIGKEANELEKIENDIKNFQSLHNASLELKNFIENPTHTIETQNKILSSLSEKLNFSKNLKNFFLLLIRFNEKSLKQKMDSNLLNSLKISSQIKLKVDDEPVNYE